jgi:hypothetical protein
MALPENQATIEKTNINIQHREKPATHLIADTSTEYEVYS